MRTGNGEPKTKNKKLQQMETVNITQTTAQLNVKEACIDNAIFNNVKLTGATFFDVAMDNIKITNANLKNLEIEGAQLGGAYIHNIGMPRKGHPMYSPNAVMHPLKLEDCMLNGSVITNCNLAGGEITDCNLTGVKISDCNLTGMTINGILVEELLRKYGE